MSETPTGYYYFLAKERQRGRKSPPPTKYWHADPICSSIPRGAYAAGPVPVDIDASEDRVVVCSCFDAAGIPVKRERRSGERSQSPRRRL